MSVEIFCLYGFISNFGKKIIMETIVIQPENDFELSILKDFLEKSHIKSRVLSEDDKEDFVLSLLMQETDYTDTIESNDFIKSLEQK